MSEKAVWPQRHSASGCARGRAHSTSAFVQARPWTEVGSTPISDANQFTQVIGAMEAGSSARLTVIRFGEQKSLTARIGERDDKDQVVRLIKKHFPEQADVLIKTVEKPIKGAIQQLPVADLKRIGVTVEETGDVVVIKSTDSEIDKLVSALLEQNDEDDENDAEERDILTSATAGRIPQKNREREELQKRIAAFLKSGGRITRIGARHGERHGSSGI